MFRARQTKRRTAWPKQRNFRELAVRPSAFRVIVACAGAVAAGAGIDRWMVLSGLCPKDLCVLSRGEQGQWIKRTSVSATLGLELVEQVRCHVVPNS